MVCGNKALGAVIVAALLLGVGGVAAQDDKPDEGPKAEAKADMKKVSYCIGLSIGRDMKSQEVELDVEDFLEGLRHGLADKEPRMSVQEMQDVMAAFRRQMVAREQEHARRLGEENAKKGAAFLAENRKKPGVKVTATGLQYKVVRAGTGKRPKVTDRVTVHYKGASMDGTEFDNSHKRGEPATFAVGGVIRGWTEALQLMKEGAKWQLVVPAELAYGARGAGPRIEPNAVLVFEVELVKIN